MVGVKVDGLREVAKTLQMLGVEVSDLKQAFNRIGNIVADEAVSLTPVMTGRLANSIRASKAKNKAVIRAGGAKVVYAGVQHYGGYNNITGSFFLTNAAERKEDEVVNEMETELNRLIERLGLD